MSIATVNTPVQNFRIRNLWIGELFIIEALLIMGSRINGFEGNFHEILINVLLLICSALLAIQLIKPKHSTDRDFFDPAFLFICFVMVSILPLAMYCLSGISYTTKSLATLNSVIFSKTVYAHAILVLSFAIAYRILIKYQQKEYGEVTHWAWTTKSWIWLTLSIWLFAYVLRFYFPDHIYLLYMVDSVKHAGLIIAIGVVLSRASSVKDSRKIFFIFAALFFIIPNICNATTESHFINKGSSFVIMLGAACYSDKVRWKGTFLTWRVLGLFFVVALVCLAGANILEDVYLGGSMPNFGQWLKKTSLALEPQVFENAGTVISWVDDGEVSMQKGKPYLHAIVNLKPFEKSFEGLSEWYAWKRNPSHAASGARYAFSAVAEGYLNYRMPGVVIQGVVLAFLAALIRFAKFSNKLGWSGVFFYAVTLRIAYYMYRTGTFEILKKFQINVLEILILLCLFAPFYMLHKVQHNAKH